MHDLQLVLEPRRREEADLRVLEAVVVAPADIGIAGVGLVLDLGMDDGGRRLLREAAALPAQALARVPDGVPRRVDPRLHFAWNRRAEGGGDRHRHRRVRRVDREEEGVVVAGERRARELRAALERLEFERPAETRQQMAHQARRGADVPRIAVVEMAAAIGRRGGGEDRADEADGAAGGRRPRQREDATRSGLLREGVRLRVRAVRERLDQAAAGVLGQDVRLRRPGAFFADVRVRVVANGDFARDRRARLELQKRAQPLRRALQGAVEEHAPAAIEERLDRREIRVAAGRDRDDEHGGVERARARGDQRAEVARADHGVERQPLLHAFADEHVLEEDDVRSRIVAAHARGVFVEGIDPDERTRLVGPGVEGVEKPRDHLARDLIGEAPPRVVDREQGDAVGHRHVAAGVHAADAQRLVEVPRFATVAVEPRAVEEPGVVGVEAKGDAVVGQFGDVRHPGDDFQPGVEVEGGPGRVHGRRDLEVPVELAQGAGVGGDLDAGGEVAAARFDDAVRVRRVEVPPEVEHEPGGLLRLFGMERLLVEEHAGDAPGLGAEAHAVGEPEVVEAQVARINLELRPEERADRGAFGDALREGGVRLRVGVEARRARHEAVGVERMALRDLPVLPELECGNGEFGPVVVGGADANRLAGDRRARFADHLDEPLQPGIRAGARVRPVLDGEVVRVPPLPLRRSPRERAGVGDAAPVRPFERPGEIARVFQDFAAVRDPQHHGDAVRGVGQRLPLREEAPADLPHRRHGFVDQRLAAQFERDVLHVHALLLLRRKESRLCWARAGAALRASPSLPLVIDKPLYRIVMRAQALIQLSET